jgi:RAB protein geranylgeranyltransferase component A
MEEKTKILIIGTGLTNSILAGALSRNINYDVSQIDCQKCYGGDEFPMKTFSELLEMPSSSIQIHLNDFDDLKYKNQGMNLSRRKSSKNLKTIQIFLRKNF